MRRLPASRGRTLSSSRPRRGRVLLPRLSGLSCDLRLLVALRAVRVLAMVSLSEYQGSLDSRVCVNDRKNCRGWLRFKFDLIQAMLRLSSSRERWSDAKPACKRYQAAAPDAGTERQANRRRRAERPGPRPAVLCDEHFGERDERHRHTSQQQANADDAQHDACTAVARGRFHVELQQLGLQLGELDRVVRQAGKAGRDVGLVGRCFAVRARCVFCSLSFDEPSQHGSEGGGRGQACAWVVGDRGANILDQGFQFFGKLFCDRAARTVGRRPIGSAKAKAVDWSDSLPCQYSTSRAAFPDCAAGVGSRCASGGLGANLLGDVGQRGPAGHRGQRRGQPFQQALRRFQLVRSRRPRILCSSPARRVARRVGVTVVFFRGTSRNPAAAARPTASPGEPPDVKRPVGHRPGRLGHVLDVVSELAAQRGHSLDHFAGFVVGVHAEYLTVTHSSIATSGRTARRSIRESRFRSDPRAADRVLRTRADRSTISAAHASWRSRRRSAAPMAKPLASAATTTRPSRSRVSSRTRAEARDT